MERESETTGQKKRKRKALMMKLMMTTMTCFRRSHVKMNQWFNVHNNNSICTIPILYFLLEHVNSVDEAFFSLKRLIMNDGTSDMNKL